MSVSTCSIISEEDDPEQLRRRVDELEKVILIQRNEILLLQSSTVEILRRLQNLEVGSKSDLGYNSLPRSRLSASKSTFSLAPPPLPRHHNNNNETPRKRDQMVNVSVGKSARGSPMRKWVSSNEPRRLSTSSEASTSTTMNPIVNSVRRLSTKNSKTIHYTAGSSFLPISVSGKLVQVPVPLDYEITAEQDPPTVKATLKHVYSYRGKDVRSNIEIVPTGELVFFSANLVVLMNLEDNSQRIYHGHTCDVKCIALHPNKILLASGQSSCHSTEKYAKTEYKTPVESPEELVKKLEEENTEAHVRIWDSVKLTTLMILHGFEKGICHVAFSRTDSGGLLVVVDDSLKHIMSVWNWQKAKKEGEVKAANDTIFECKWHPTIRNLLVLYGKGHFSFFNFDPATGILVKTVAAFEGRDKPKTVLSLCFGPDGQVITGDSNGTISIWDPKSYRTIKQAHSVHPGGVYALSLGKSGKLLISGGKDKMISEWDVNDLVRTRRPVEVPDEKGFPRVIIQNGNEIILGTSSNTLLRGNFEGNGLATIIEGDSEPLTNLQVCGDNQLITTSQCGTLRIWNISDRKPEFTRKFMNSIECVDVDSTKTHLILGFSNATWNLMNIQKQNTILEHKEAFGAVCEVRFTPVGSTFAVATNEPSLTIYRLDGSKNLLTLAKIPNLPAPIQNIDFSEDCQHLRGQSTSHLHFWSKTGEISNGRDLKWAGNRVKLSAECALVVHSSNGQVHCSSQNGKVLAVGMENGTIRLYDTPVTSTTAGFVELLGHGKQVKNVDFSGSDRLFSCSPTDNSIFEWKLE